MKKKIIIGIIITVILSLTAFGTIYAYQKETSKFESSVVQEKYNSDQYSADPGENYNEYTFQSEQNCLMIEERNMNNLRLREQDCDCEERNMNNLRLREQDCDCEGDCEEDRQFENQNGNTCNGRKTRQK